MTIIDDDEIWSNGLKEEKTSDLEIMDMVKYWKIKLGTKLTRKNQKEN